MDKKKYLNLKNKYQKGKLPNGLKYICSPNNLHNSCSIVFLVRVGSRNERTMEYGFSHYLEHMLFKGTKKWKSYKTLNQKIDNLQASSNASTYKNMTRYYFKLPGKNFKEGLELMTDMVLHSILDSRELEKEKKVVIEEINKTIDDSLDYASDLMDRKLFENTLSVILYWEVKI